MPVYVLVCSEASSAVVVDSPSELTEKEKEFFAKPEALVSRANPFETVSARYVTKSILGDISSAIGCAAAAVSGPVLVYPRQRSFPLRLIRVCDGTFRLQPTRDPWESRAGDPRAARAARGPVPDGLDAFFRFPRAPDPKTDGQYAARRA